MNILADENCGTSLLSALRECGHSVTSIVRTLKGADDDAVFELAKAENRVLLTNDRDFGLLAEQAQQRPPAILLMRLRNLSAKTRNRIVVQTVADLSDSLIGHLTVIEPHQIRSRAYKDKN